MHGCVVIQLFCSTYQVDTIDYDDYAMLVVFVNEVY